MNVTETQICALFCEITTCFSDRFGTPLPKRLLTIGNADAGWQVRLNTTKETVDGVEPYKMVVLWNGCPAGIIDAAGGIIAAGEAANEDTLMEWLKGAACNA